MPSEIQGTRYKGSAREEGTRDQIQFPIAWEVYFINLLDIFQSSPVDSEDNHHSSYMHRIQWGFKGQESILWIDQKHDEMFMCEMNTAPESWKGGCSY